MHGIILAKEKSRRLPCNKALIEIKGEPLIERIIKIIRQYCEDILIISDDERLSAFGKRFSDIFKDKGPISGLYTGLYYSNSLKNLVLASDMPFLEGKIIELINIDGDFQAIVPTIEGKPEPLCAIYLKTCLPLIKEQIEKDEFSLNTLIKRLNTIYINCDRFKNSFFNLNTEEQLWKYQRMK